MCSAGVDNMVKGSGEMGEYDVHHALDKWLSGSPGDSWQSKTSLVMGSGGHIKFLKDHSVWGSSILHEVFPSTVLISHL